MRKYFEEELRLLREAMQAFSGAYPEQAQQLNLANANNDPYIERLLEGTAYLTAQIRQRIDDDIPEICENLLMQLSPQLLRPFPAATIMEFKPRLHQLQQTYLLAKHTPVNSQAVGETNDKIVCQFRTTAALKINPLQLSDVEFSATNGGTLIQFKLSSELPLAKLDLRQLPIYLCDTSSNALQMHFALTQQIQQIHLAFEQNKIKTPVLLKQTVTLQSFNFTAEETLLPHSAQNLLGLQLLHEYFNCRDKFLFVSLCGLEKIPLAEYQQLCVQIHTQLPFVEQAWSKTILRLHCVPAINLFTTCAEPIYLNHQRSAYPVFVDNIYNAQTEVYSVDKLVGIDERNGQHTVYTPLHSFQHQQNKAYFTTTRRMTNANCATTYLSVGGVQPSRTEILSSSITASNGHIPRRFLAAHFIQTPAKNFPSFIEFTNLIPASPMLMPPQREQYCWELISHLACHYQTLSDLRVLKQVLSSYDWTSRHDNQQKITGIQQLTVKSVQQITRGSLWQGLEFNLLLQEEHYFSLADMHLFGEVLHQFFCFSAMINLFVITKINCYPSGKEWQWQTWQGAALPI